MGKEIVSSWQSQFLKDVHFEKVLVLNKIYSGEKTKLVTCIMYKLKYLIGNLYNDHKVKTLYLMLPKTRENYQLKRKFSPRVKNLNSRVNPQLKRKFSNQEKIAKSRENYELTRIILLKGKVKKSCDTKNRLLTNIPQNVSVYKFKNISKQK